jgi:hypothetical protein
VQKLKIVSFSVSHDDEKTAGYGDQNSCANTGILDMGEFAKMK